MKNTLFILILLSSIYSLASTDTEKLHQVINKYRNTPAVEMKISKTVKMKLLGDTQESFGDIYLSSNKMRYTIEKPGKHLVVMNDDSIWIENRLPKKLGGKIQVTHLKSKSGQNKVKGFLAAFFGNKNIDEDMSFEKIDSENFKIKFKKKSQIKDIKSASIGIDTKSEEIKYIEYTDKIKNITRHNFSAVNFKTKKDNDKFKYSIPKGAEVTEM